MVRHTPQDPQSDVILASNCESRSDWDPGPQDARRRAYGKPLPERTLQDALQLVERDRSWNSQCSLDWRVIDVSEFDMQQVSWLREGSSKHQSFLYVPVFGTLLGVSPAA